MKFIIIAVLLLAAHFAFASKACFCEVGNKPKIQKMTFSYGCTLWLKAQQGCTIKEKVPYETDYTKLNMPADTTEVSIGYVGHWSPKDSGIYSENNMVTYIRWFIEPLMHQKNISVSIDNTACLAMAYPQDIVEYMNKNASLFRDKKLTVKGNQVDSIGKWDVLFGTKYNFYATVSSDTKAVIYPQCQEFENAPCSSVQFNEVGTCNNNGSLASLKCCKGKSNKMSWLPPSDCTPLISI